MHGKTYVALIRFKHQGKEYRPGDRLRCPEDATPPEVIILRILTPPRIKEVPFEPSVTTSPAPIEFPIVGEGKTDFVKAEPAVIKGKSKSTK